MNSDKKKRRPTRTELDREAEELRVEWKDGHTSRYSRAHRRRGCTCADCREKRQERSAPEPGELVLLDGAAATATAAVRRIDPVGHYGIRITWADGHDYGIYTFKALREMDEEG